MTLYLLKGILRALEYMHSHFLIHNDVRADNIVISEKGHVQLTGMRQMQTRLGEGKINPSVFSLAGDNLEWAAPEVVSQVGLLSRILCDSIGSTDKGISRY